MASAPSKVPKGKNLADAYLRRKDANYSQDECMDFKSVENIAMEEESSI